MLMWFKRRRLRSLMIKRGAYKMDLSLAHLELSLLNQEEQTSKVRRKKRSANKRVVSAVKRCTKANAKIRKLRQDVVTIFPDYSTSQFPEPDFDA